MGITLHCACGKKYKAKDEAVGKKVKCPSCGEAQRVRAPDDDDGDERDEREEARPRKRRKSEEGEGRKKKKREDAREGWMQHSFLGLRIGGWLIVLGVLGAIAVALVVILPKAIPALS